MDHATATSLRMSAGSSTRRVLDGHEPKLTRLRTLLPAVADSFGMCQRVRRRAGGPSRRAGEQASRRAGEQASRRAGEQASRRAGEQASRRAGELASRRAGELASRPAGPQANRPASTMRRAQMSLHLADAPRVETVAQATSTGPSDGGGLDGRLVERGGGGW